MFVLKMKMLKLDQYQEAGATTINELKNILITVLSATFVIKGQMTLGMMLAVSYILGQLNGPLAQMIDFFHSTQDARLSLERLNDIYEKPDEVTAKMNPLDDIPLPAPISLHAVTFRYEGPHSPAVLHEIDLEIPVNKTTAIVGVSGSGKTTLIKLLLGFYAPESGEIRIGEQSLQHLHPRKWREKCGVVMQDGYIFSDTIARNIGLMDEEINAEKLREVIQLTNLQEFLISLPMGLNTRIGMNGQGISQGQKQRILIARALYKDPKYLFLDEATNALDAANEKTILENLAGYMEQRTAVVVAHRLSTVKNAAKIVVLDHGRIKETGTHEELLQLKGIYYGLIKNQLELGI
jgi:ATP-binding cassette, subfamily B, bacterial